MFFRACRYHSTKSAKWGAFDTICPLVCKRGGNCPLCPPPLHPHPGSAAYTPVLMVIVVMTMTIRRRKREKI